MAADSARGPDTQGFTLLDVGLIRFDAGVWPRAHLDDSRTEEFAELYAEGGADALPPLDVVPDGAGRYLLADGVHRFAAAGLADLPAIPTTTIPLPGGLTPEQAAHQHAVATASRTAKPLTRTERSNAVLRLLEEQPTLSDRDIADICGVSHQTVGRRRHELTDQPSRRDREAPPNARESQHEEVVARRLFKALEKVWEARGLGVGDFFAGRDRTGERLARVLATAYGEGALERAHLFQRWVDEAVSALSAGAE